MTLMQRTIWLGSLFIVCVHGIIEDFTHPSHEFSTHSIIKPSVYLNLASDKRQLHTTKKYVGSLEHHHDLTLKLDVDGKERLLDLQLNRNLLPKNHFVKTQKNGSHVVNKFQPSEVELCQYQGSIRHVPNSWAAISTCNGLRGVLFDGTTTHYIERTPDNSGHITGEHVIYSHEKLVVNHTCGFEGTPHDVLNSFHRIRHIDRRKRSPQLIRGPYNANRNSRFVELILVVDHKLYEGMGKNIDGVHSHCKDIANIINALFVPLNIFIALVGVVVWTELDEIALSTKGDTTLTNFLHYRREKLVKEHPNDNAQLLSRVQFEGGVVGKALKGPICTYEFSGGVSMDHSPVVGLVATTVAHEMGHNFGMEHDTPACECPDDRCIMAPSSSSMSPTHWSSCSLSYLAEAFEHGMDYCLRNRPERLFDSPVCGNGFVEPGEQCDCGLRDRCTNPCCNATTCMLHSNASCATGECCDLSTCHPVVGGTMCRSADHECDLPEYCTGESEFCPVDVFKMDGETCDWGKAFCYQGSCRSHTDQCKLLWGPSGKSSDFRCYRMNTKGSRHGNCGYNRLNQSYIKCYDENIYCGMLHCMHLSEKLEFGMESVAILSHSFINNGGSVIPCRTAMVDLGLNEVDPGLAPDGAKCADGKMCVGQRCLAVGSLMAGTECRDNCNGNGVCNSMGHCHCNTGFAPPFCYGPGTGGSEDSGPASQPNARKEVITAFYVVFLGIVPGVALVSFFVYYVKRNPTPFRRRVKKPHQQRPTINDKKTQNGMANGPHGGRAVASNLSSAGSRPFDSLLVPNNQSPSTEPPADFQHSLIGRHDGFIITPIHPTQREAQVTPNRPAPRVPDRPAPTNSTDGASAPLSPSRPAPQVPRVDVVDSSRPVTKSVPALTRIASFMRGQQKNEANKRDRRPKIDREALRSLEISAPIMSDSGGVEPSSRGAPVSRAHSMRDSTVVKRPQLPSFGSMRVSNGGAGSKRPTSVPAATRPTSPPPPRPPSMDPTTHEYDDCLDRTTVALAPLAHIEEESPRIENIYAVIEENPKETPVQEPTLGLLGEIVSEIEARNTDSIYSAATLKRKKEKEKEAKKEADKSSGDTYVNTSSWKANETDKESSCVSSSGCSSSNSSNSGYLSPINGVNRAEPVKPATGGPSVPEKAAPYRPYSSSLVRSSGPFLASATAAATNKPSTALKRTKTPPSLFPQNQPPTNKAPSLTAPPLVIAKPVVKPDLVSSCETPGNEPDVIGDKQVPPAAAAATTGGRGVGFKPPVAKKKPTTAVSAPSTQTPGNNASIRAGQKVASLQAKFEASKPLNLRGGSKETPPSSGVKR